MDTPQPYFKPSISKIFVLISFNAIIATFGDRNFHNPKQYTPGDNKPTMICPRCLFRTTPRIKPPTTPLCPQTTTLRRPYADNRKPISGAQNLQSTPQRHPAAATSTSAAQPFSTPEVSSPQTVNTPVTPSNNPEDASASPQTHPPRPKQAHQPSSVPGGTPLLGLNYFKNKPDPVAMDDDEYPSWLWSVLTTEKQSAIGATNVTQDPRLYARSARARRAAKKELRKEALLNPEAKGRKTPVFAQALDLPVGEGVESGRMADQARGELRKAMRAKRRNEIREANFLSGLR